MADGLARQLPGPEALGRGWSPRGRSRPPATSRSARTTPRFHRERGGRRPSRRPGVSVAPRGPQHRDALLGGGGDVDVGGGRRGTNRWATSGRSRTGPFTLSDSTMSRSGAFGFDARGARCRPRCRGRSGLVVDPTGSSTDVGEGTEGVEAGTAERWRSRGARMAVGHGGDSVSRGTNRPHPCINTRVVRRDTARSPGLLRTQAGSPRGRGVRGFRVRGDRGGSRSSPSWNAATPPAMFPRHDAFLRAWRVVS